MLSAPDFKEKQIVFIQSFDSKNLKFVNSNLVLQNKDGGTLYKISCFRIFTIFIQGDFTFSSVLIRKAREFGISIYLLNRNLSLYSNISSETEGNYLLREKQYKMENKNIISRQIIANKIQNQIELLREIRDKEHGVKSTIRSLEGFKEKSLHAENEASLMGIEGNAAKLFFKQYFKDLKWQKRLPRTKYDIPNLLLDIGYTYLFNFIDANLSLYGFDTYKGIMHQPFYQRKSLTCDVMEPFRCIIDKALYKAYKLNQINPKDFKVAKGQYLLDYDKSQKYTRIFLDAIMTHKGQIFAYIQRFYREVMRESKEVPNFKF